MAKNLHELLREVGLPFTSAMENPLILKISCNSQEIEKGSLFLGLPGSKVDGGIFWPEAISSGAVAAVISESAASMCSPGSSEPVIIVSEPVSKWIGELAAAFFSQPSKTQESVHINCL